MNDLPGYVLNRHGAKLLLPVVTRQDHKGSRGRSLVLAGSPKFPGAGILAVKAALRTGSGYVYWSAQSPATAVDLPDAIPLDLQKPKWQQIPSETILVGPGFDQKKLLHQVLLFLRAKKTSVTVDADALRIAADKKLFPFAKSWILTPHLGELSYCLKIPVADLQKNRRRAVTLAQQTLGGVVLLKGPSTLICDGKRVVRIPVGNSSLAKSGTGDVLAGIITGFRAQGLSAFKAALLGAYVHGLISEIWVQDGCDPLSLMASDVVEMIPRALATLRNN